jgi:hypothetical protein
MIEVEGLIVAFDFSKKYNLSLRLTSGRVFDRCPALTDLQVTMPTSGGSAWYSPPASFCMQGQLVVSSMAK